MIKRRRPPLYIHDEIKRRRLKPLYYTMKALSNGRKNKAGKVGVKEWHLYISSKPPEQPDECYFVAPAALFKGDEYKLEFLPRRKYDDYHVDACAFLDKDRVRKVTGKL